MELRLLMEAMVDMVVMEVIVAMEKDMVVDKILVNMSLLSKGDEPSGSGHQDNASGSGSGKAKKGKSGLRKGDPLSPYLFVLSMEILSRYLRKICLQQNVSFHPKCTKLGLTHLIFADDLMIFTRGDVPSVTAVLNTLNDFSKWSGLSANTDKTDIYFGGVPDTITHQISCILVFLRIQTHLHHWTTNFFSYAGRAQLLNSVIFGLTNFWCATALLPKNVVKLINKLCKNFFWNQEDGHRKLVFKSWSDICSPWNEGGVDIKELLSWNKAVLAKWIWTLDSQQDGLWSSWLVAYYFSTDTIWSIQSKDHLSESLKSIIAVREEILHHTHSPVAASALIHSWTSKGKFNIAEAYHWFRKHKPILDWTPALHHQFVIPSHRVLTTLALQHKLPTLDNLACRGLHMVKWCILCKGSLETHEHIFSTCSFTQKILQGIYTWLGLQGRSTIPTAELIWCAAKQHYRHWKNGWIRSSITATCYQIWHERNARIFQGVEHTEAQILHLIRFNVSARISHRVTRAVYDQAIQRLILF
ncbi:uncharacterized protein LOC141620213 [Silene latifolia]|uniref:uncharacterized protein LOC141620213 n=1 Tax=Silene latifolia TaxID=37657 RepID=UPI003D774EE7